LGTFTKDCWHQGYSFGSNMDQIVLGWGFSPDRTAELTVLPPKPLTVLGVGPRQRERKGRIGIGSKRWREIGAEREKRKGERRV